MGQTQPRKKDDGPRRGVLAHPLEALVFLFPLIVLYEVVSRIGGQRVIANDLTQMFFNVFGGQDTWVPAVGVVVILLATHVVSGQKWRVRISRVLLMYIEVLVLAVPLLVLSRTLPLGPTVAVDGWLADVALSVGAGVYEELVFRLAFISFVMIVGVDIFRLSKGGVAVAAMVLSSLAFAAHHHPPMGHEPFAIGPFAFRTIAGGYLAIVFWFRGYGSAAGCHAAYNIAVRMMGG